MDIFYFRGESVKKNIGLILYLVLLTGLCFASDPCEGYWISYDEKTGKATAGWEISVQDGILSGKITSLADHQQDSLADGAKGKHYNNFSFTGDLGTLMTVGTSWIWGLSKKAEGEWEKGYIIDPADGSRYKCKMKFHKAGESKKYQVDTLEMRGEIGLGIGRSQYWKKATKEEASGLR